MSVRTSIYFYFIAFLFALHSCWAHPFTNFFVFFAQENGSWVNEQPNITAGIPQTLAFVIADNTNNWKSIELGELEPMHQRYAHVVFGSFDMTWTSHIHPDDFTDMAALPSNTTVFHVTTTFPRAGQYSVLITLLYKDNRTNSHREGNAQMSFRVDGTPSQGKPPSWDEDDNSITRNFVSYPIGSNDVFDNWIEMNANRGINTTEPTYRATFKVYGSNETDRNIVPHARCTYFTLTVYHNSTSNTPARMIPYLAAPAHFTFAVNDGALYHAHGGYLMPGQNVSAYQEMIKANNMDKLMRMNPMVNPIYNATMNAYMIGFAPNGSLDCTSDMGAVMDEMMGMMDMNEYYGPPDFTTIVGVFPFPEAGPYRVWAWMKMKLETGEERLIIPQFNIFAPIDDPSSAPVSSMMSSSVQEQENSAASVLQLSCLLALVLFFIRV